MKTFIGTFLGMVAAGIVLMMFYDITHDKPSYSRSTISRPTVSRPAHYETDAPCPKDLKEAKPGCVIL